MRPERKHILWILIIAIAIKLAYIGFAYLVDWQSSYFGFSHDVKGYVSLFKRNDTYWYESIHDRGYDEVTKPADLGWSNEESTHQSNWGFMPGYPMLTKVLSYLGLSFDGAAFLLAFVFSIVCFLLFYWLASIWFENNEQAFFATLLFICFPFHYYYSAMYTESIYMTLLLGSLIAIVKKKWMILVLLSSFMVILRANGILMLLPLGLFLWEQNKALRGIRFNSEVFSKTNLLRISLLILPVLVFTGYCYYQYVHTGDAFAYSTAQQQGWRRELMFPLAGLFRMGTFVGQFNSYYAIFFMLIAIAGAKKLPLSFNLIIWLSILLPMAAGNVEGMPRYVSIIFPFMLLVTWWLRNLRFRYWLIPMLFGLQLFTFYFWLVSDPFSR